MTTHLSGRNKQSTLVKASQSERVDICSGLKRSVVAMQRERESKPVPVAVIMITLNEAHNIDAALENLKGWAQEIYVVDSLSSDGTVEIARKGGAHVVQHLFNGFGDQWNFALRTLPIRAPWTMKLDPDERLGDDLKSSIRDAIESGEADGIIIRRRLWFMGRPLPVRQSVLRLWRTGLCRFTDVLVNEHPMVEGRLILVQGDLEHLESVTLHHWLDKQNRYTTAEAATLYKGLPLAEKPHLFGTSLQKRMWLKAHFYKLPMRYFLLFLYLFWVEGAWRGGRAGYAWARLRTEVYRAIEFKVLEMRLLGHAYEGRQNASVSDGAGP